ncbi:MAG: hypothetical protein KGI59_00520 [Patescibacteria group bacterium]|nr:hypothetical protein [Patescibacteria group bacterium]
MKKFLKIVFVLIAVAILFFVALALIGYYHQRTLTTPSSQKSAGTTLVADSDWLSYSNVDLGYSIKYPPSKDHFKENIIYGDPREVVFYYDSGKIQGKNQVDRWSKQNCDILYPKLNIKPNSEMRVGDLSFYYGSVLNTYSSGVTMYDGVMATVPGTFPDGSCMLLHFIAANADGSSMTDTESEDPGNVLYTMASTVKLLAAGR